MNPTPEKDVLQVEGLTKTFAGPEGPVAAVAGVDLSVRPGEFVAVHGPSGCGKSTFMLMVGGLLAPDGGSIKVSGSDPYQLGPGARAAFRARHVGFLFQEFNLIPYLDVLDNVTVPRLARAGAASGASDGDGDPENRARSLLDGFGLASRLRHTPAALSAGEQQRVALARALLNNPPLLLADEPTGNLDGENAARVIEAFQQHADGGGAVVMVTHEPSALAAAGRQVKMKAGRFEGEGK